jgi:hypothetical protein
MIRITPHQLAKAVECSEQEAMAFLMSAALCKCGELRLVVYHGETDHEDKPVLDYDIRYGFPEHPLDCLYCGKEIPHDAMRYDFLYVWGAR